MSRIVGLQKCEVNKFSAEKRRNGTERNVEYFIRVSEYPSECIRISVSRFTWESWSFKCGLNELLRLFPYWGSFYPYKEINVYSCDQVM